MTSPRNTPATAPRAPAPARRRRTQTGAPLDIMHDATTLRVVAKPPNANGCAVADVPDHAPPPNAGAMITLDEMQQRLRLGPTALRSLTREPDFPPIARLSPKHRLVDLDRLNNFLAARWRMPPPARAATPIVANARGRRQAGVAKHIDAARMADAIAEKVSRARRSGGPQVTLQPLGESRRTSAPAGAEFLHIGELALQLRTTLPHVQRLLRRPGAPPILWLGPRAQLVRRGDVDGWLARTCEQTQHALPAAAGGRP